MCVCVRARSLPTLFVCVGALSLSLSLARARSLFVCVTWWRDSNATHELRESPGTWAAIGCFRQIAPHRSWARCPWPPSAARADGGLRLASATMVRCVAPKKIKKKSMEGRSHASQHLAPRLPVSRFLFAAAPPPSEAPPVYLKFSVIFYEQHTFYLLLHRPP